ncbi:hypothetical protein NP493_21g01035 [Ridgeia piscesae]|uniref:Uncharacterized protein n=1 Tax=Ridgeia piscesae TaxID=27915 RepID=A0AAD9PE30_RIDPI|nr:hypothetical protein NP493_21g01035 [Ridgeia piscesae]
MCSEKTKHLWYKYYGLFVRMYITSQQSYLSQINTRQTSFEAFRLTFLRMRDICKIINVQRKDKAFMV